MNNCKKSRKNFQTSSTSSKDELEYKFLQHCQSINLYIANYYKLFIEENAFSAEVKMLFANRN